MTEKHFFKINFFRIIGILIFLAAVTVIVDPYFHYHKPFSFMSYRLGSQRYINNGIVKHFDYNAIIAGSSMIENFKNSQFDELFGTNSIKVPLSGASFKEVNDRMETALKYNKNIKYIFRGLDYKMINKDSNFLSYDSYPTYLYDENFFNDYKYWWNRDIFIKGVLGNVIRTIKRKPNPKFDDYGYWFNETPGKEAVLKGYIRPKKEEKQEIFTEEDKKRVNKNIEENVTRLSKKYPNVKFIYFITPYSIIYWDELNQKGEVEKQIMAEKYMIEKILEVPNIELYSFFDKYNLITDLNNYRDEGHYIKYINNDILLWVKEGKYKLTEDNYKEYINKNLEFYKNYNYDKIFEN